MERCQNDRVLGLGKWCKINSVASAKRIGIPSCYISINIKIESFYFGYVGDRFVWRNYEI